MSRFWSPIIHELSPYTPGEQPDPAHWIKLNTNENPYGPSPKVLEAIDAEAQSLRLYPEPDADRLKRAVAVVHNVSPTQVFAGNGSDEVLAHAFVALLDHKPPCCFRTSRTASTPLTVRFIAFPIGPYLWTTATRSG
jgi:histidinol-phosphate aminotransferase